MAIFKSTLLIYQRVILTVATPLHPTHPPDNASNATAEKPSEKTVLRTIHHPNVCFFFFFGCFVKKHILHIHMYVYILSK